MRRDNADIVGDIKYQTVSPICSRSKSPTLLSADRCLDVALIDSFMCFATSPTDARRVRARCLSIAIRRLLPSALNSRSASRSFIPTFYTSYSLIRSNKRIVSIVERRRNGGKEMGGGMEGGVRCGGFLLGLSLSLARRPPCPCSGSFS
jgi:hypothetical protein